MTKLPSVTPDVLRLRVLIVAAAAQDAELLSGALAETGLATCCTHVVTQSEYLSALRSSPDLILAEFVSSQFRELEALDLMQAHGFRIPFIFVATTADAAQIVAAIKSGADDFLVHSDRKRLPAAVRAALDGKRMRDQQEQAERRQTQQIQTLNERVKELTTLRHASHLLQQDDLPLPVVLQRLVDLLPAAWQFPETTAACLTLDRQQYTSERFVASDRRQSVGFHTEHGRDVRLEIVCTEPPETASAQIETEASFLAEERELLDTLAEMLRNCLERRESKQVLIRDSFLLSHVQDATIVTDVAGVVTYWNVGATRLYGWTAEEMLGRPFTDRFPEPEREWVAEQIRERVSGKDWKGEYHDWRKDGTRVWVDAHVTRLVDDQGRVIGVLGLSRDITARKESEAAVELGERRYRDLVESSHDLIWSIDAESRITFMNQAAKAIYGWDSHELIGKSFLAFVTPESFDETLKTFITLVETGAEQLDYECGVFRKDGSVVRLSTNVRAQRDSEGNIIGVSGISRDLTQLMNATQELRERELLLSNAERIADMGSWDIDLRTGTFKGSAQTFKLFGLDPDRCDGTLDCLLTHVHSSDHERVLAALSCTEVATKYVEQEFRVQHPRGEVRLLRERGEVVLDETGRVIRRLGLVQDITEQERNLIALRKSEERFQLAAEGSSAGIWDWDVETGDLYYSPRFKQLLGYSDEEFPDVFASFAEVLHPDDNASFRFAIDEHFYGNRPFDTEFRLRTKSGAYRWFNTRGDALRDASGKPYRMAGSTIDIHAQKEVAQDLRAIRIQQRELIEQLEIKQARLAEAQAIAKIGSWEMDLRTMNIEWSDEMYSIFDKPAGSFTPTHASFLKLVHPADRKQVNDALIESLDSEEACRIEHRILLDNGDEKWVEEFWRASNDEQGNPAYAVGTCRDISDAKHAEEQLRRLNEELELRVAQRTQELVESGRRHQTLLANLQGMAYRCRDDPDWTMEFVSEGCRDLFGIAPERLTQGDRHYPSFIHPDDLAQVVAVVAEGLRKREPIQFEYRIRTFDGQTKWVWEQARGIYNDQGQVESIEGLISDITDRKLRELRENHQSQLLKMLASDAPLDACLSQIVSSVVAEDTSWMCNLMLADDHQTVLVNHASLNLPASYLQVIDGSPVEPDGAPFSRAAFEKHPVMAHDIGSESECRRWAADAQQAGIRSCWSLPILSIRDELLGTLSVYTTQSREPHTRERERLEWATELARLAIEHTSAKQSLVDSEAFNRVTLDALSAHIAVLNSRGEIVATNQAWKHFATTSETEFQRVSEGTNYLDVCVAAVERGDPDARRVVAALCEIAAGERESWSYQYACHSPQQERWFQLRMRRIHFNGEVHILMAHENVTSIKQSEITLRRAVVHAEEASRA
ncbi:MAG: PAS domain S-box protein, partial [Novipirellula sp. JB048]